LPYLPGKFKPLEHIDGAHHALNGKS